MEANDPKTLPAMDVLRDGAILALIGWAGIALLINVTVPFLLPRWLFYFCLSIAMTGTALPLVWYLNRRFSPEQFPSGNVLWREGMEVGGLIALLAWLQVGRILSAALGWIFFAVFLAVEILLRVYENSRWTPADRTSRPSPPAFATGDAPETSENSAEVTE
jgi:hypothetical protein